MAIKDINEYGKFENFFQPGQERQEESEKEKLADFLMQQQKPRPQDPFSLGNFGGSGLFKPVK